MAALDFPDNPSTGTTYDKWTWNGSMWVFTNGVGAGYTFVQEFTPTATKQGDTWFDTSTTAAGGTSWVAVLEGAAGSELVWVQTSPGAGGPMFQASTLVGYEGAVGTLTTGNGLLFFGSVGIDIASFNVKPGDTLEVTFSTYVSVGTGGGAGSAFSFGVGAYNPAVGATPYVELLPLIGNVTPWYVESWTFPQVVTLSTNIIIPAGMTGVRKFLPSFGKTSPNSRQVGANTVPTLWSCTHLRSI